MKEKSWVSQQWMRKRFRTNLMNEENNRDQVTDADMVEGISHAEIINAIKAMKTGKAAGPSEVNFEMIVLSGQVGEQAMRKLC